MKNMTYAEALTIVKQTVEALDLPSAFTAEQIDKVNEALERIEALREKYSVSRPASDKVKEARKAKNAAARAELVAKVKPVVISVMSDTPMTAAEIYERASAELSDDWTILKVQYLLLHELADMVNKFETKGKPNTYALCK